MGQARLNGLAMMYYYRHILLKADEVVQEFAAPPRKLIKLTQQHIVLTHELCAHVVKVAG